MQKKTKKRSSYQKVVTEKEALKQEIKQLKEDIRQLKNHKRPPLRIVPDLHD